jgi:hypothetical protein
MITSINYDVGLGKNKRQVDQNVAELRKLGWG